MIKSIECVKSHIQFLLCGNRLYKIIQKDPRQDMDFFQVLYINSQYLQPFSCQSTCSRIIKLVQSPIEVSEKEEVMIRQQGTSPERRQSTVLALKWRKQPHFEALHCLTGWNKVQLTIPVFFILVEKVAYVFCSWCSFRHKTVHFALVQYCKDTVVQYYYYHHYFIPQVQLVKVLWWVDQME